MKKFTILIAALALVGFSVPAMAQVDWNFYGSARMATYWVSEDFGDGMNVAGTDDKDQDLQWDLQGNSRIGATVKAENINARFEFGVTESNVGSRRLYGVWNFGAGKMKVGKDYTPIIRVGPTTTGLGLEFDTYLFGIQIGIEEGIEFHFLNLTFGVDFFPPAIKLPFVPRLGFPKPTFFD